MQGLTTLGIIQTWQGRFVSYCWCWFCQFTHWDSVCRLLRDFGVDFVTIVFWTRTGGSSCGFLCTKHRITWWYFALIYKNNTMTNRPKENKFSESEAALTKLVRQPRNKVIHLWQHDSEQNLKQMKHYYHFIFLSDIQWSGMLDELERRIWGRKCSPIFSHKQVWIQLKNMPIYFRRQKAKYMITG